MKYNAQALASVTPTGIITAVHPCQVTHNLLQAFVTLQQAVEQYDGGLFEDSGTFPPLYREVAIGATNLVPHLDLGRELDALKSTYQRLDLRPQLTTQQLLDAPINVAAHLTFALRETYAMLLKKIVTFSERIA